MTRKRLTCGECGCSLVPYLDENQNYAGGKIILKCPNKSCPKEYTIYLKTSQILKLALTGVGGL